MTNTKVLLNDIFPAGICDEICNYNFYCFKCKILNLKENWFQKKTPQRQTSNNIRKTNMFLQNRNANTIFFIQYQPSRRSSNEKRNRCLDGYIQIQTRIQTWQTVLNGDYPLEILIRLQVWLYSKRKWVKQKLRLCIQGQ